ncbi:MAG: YlxR family protein [Clostridium sp.]|nr:YlxR family protein [Clostridium sp.]MCM1397965.1 YlxR family protein [Clostridium sp.]MCM1459399.1 YlxR family protein [Bacteroides sp.]
MAKQIPKRQCLGCREMKAKNELVRVIRTVDNTVCLDLKGKQNGRGAYICRDIKCFEKAVKTKALERALKLSIPDEIYQSISRELN